MTSRGNSFATWFKANLSAHAEDIATHGADERYPCIATEAMCCALFDRFAADIWEMAVDHAESQARTVLELLPHLRDAGLVDDWNGFRTLMVRFACEYMATPEVDDVDS